MVSYFDLLAPVYERIIIPKKPDKLVESLQLLDTHRIVEIGGGTGRIIQYFVPLVKDVWIIDPSGPMLHQAKLKYPQIHLVQAFADAIPLPDAFFDLAIIYDSLHHWQQHQDSLDEIYRLLKKGGELVICEIHPSTRSGYFIVLMERFFRMRSTFYNPSALKKIMVGSGFEVTEVDWLTPPTYYVRATK